MAKPAIPIIGEYPRAMMVMRNAGATITETHWWNAQNDYAGALAALRTLGNMRMALVGNDVQMILARVSLENVLRDSDVIDLSLINPPIDNGPADPRARSLNIRIEGTSKWRKTLFLGLIPDAIVVASKYDGTVVPNYDTNLLNYLRALTATQLGSSPWGFLVHNTDVGVCPSVVVTGYAQVRAGLGTYTTKTPHRLTALPPNNVVRVQRTATAQGFTADLDGLFVVTSVPSATSFTVVTTSLRGSANLIKGKARKMQRIFQKYDNFLVRGIGRHIRGNRVFQPLGRRKTRA